MKQQSKILSSPFKDYIEKELLSGVSYRQLSDELKGKGVNISYSALSSYHHKHMEGKVQLEGVVQNEVEEVVLEAFEYNSNISIVKTLNEAYKRQAQIFTQKQDLYMSGSGRFPSNDLKALKDLNVLVKSHHYNLTSMNHQLETKEESFEELKDSFAHIVKEGTFGTGEEKIIVLIENVDLKKEDSKTLFDFIKSYERGKLLTEYSMEPLINPYDFNTFKGVSWLEFENRFKKEIKKVWEKEED